MRDWGWPVCPPQSLELGEGMSTPAAEHLTERCVAVSPSLGPGHRRGHTRDSPSPSLTFITLSRGRVAAPRGRSAVGGADQHLQNGQTDEGDVGKGCQGRHLGQGQASGQQAGGWEGRLSPVVLRHEGYPMSCAPALLQAPGTLGGGAWTGLCLGVKIKPVHRWATCLCHGQPRRGWPCGAQRPTGTLPGPRPHAGAPCLSSAVCRWRRAGASCRHTPRQLQERASGGTFLQREVWKVPHGPGVGSGKALPEPRVRREGKRIFSGREGTSPGTSPVLLAFPPV